MDLLLDTHVLVWLAGDNPRLGGNTRAAVAEAGSLFVSAVVAYEFTNLCARGKFGVIDGLGVVLTRFHAEVLDYPAEAWRIVERLPDVHRDPIDRMLIAHAIHADLTLLTADKAIHKYPVRTLW